MRAIVLAIAVSTAWGAEIQDVLRAADIDKIAARTKTETTVHEGNGYRIDFIAVRGRPKQLDPGRDADQIVWVHRGTGRLTLEGKTYEISRGDFLRIPRRTKHAIEPTGRMEFIAVRVFPDGSSLPPRTGLLAPRTMPHVLPKAAIQETFEKFDRNQPLHSAPNFTVNYVIYNLKPGPWEAHRGCVDIYFIHYGTGTAVLGGMIENPTEESPGEIRGTGVTSALEYTITRGDMVVIPRNGAHHMKPLTAKLGYLLMKVWVE